MICFFLYVCAELRNMASLLKGKYYGLLWDLTGLNQVPVYCKWYHINMLAALSWASWYTLV